MELQTTRELLVSSLNKVQGLEVESKKVPRLKERIAEMERTMQHHQGGGGGNKK